MYKVGQMVEVGNKTGQIKKILKNNKYKVTINFRGNLRDWDFEEIKLKKIKGFYYQ